MWCEIILNAVKLLFKLMINWIKIRNEKEKNVFGYYNNILKSIMIKLYNYL